MKKITLNSQYQMPQMGLGTFLLSPKDAEEAVVNALACGYRLIDTANAYLNEKAVGRAIKRSGRLGNLIEVKKPDEKGCLDILNHYLKNKSVNNNFDREEFAKKLHDLSCTGADINVIVENAMDRMYERYGIYEKMDNGTYKKSDLDNLQYENEDFEKSLEDLKNLK